MNKSYDKLTNYDKDKIVETFMNGSMVRDIPSILNVSERAVSRVLKDSGINSKRANRYTLNEEYFDCIDTERKAYILGLLFSDGYVGNCKFNNVSLSLIEDDFEILSLIKDEIEFTGNIRKAKRNGGYISDKDLYVINFSSKHMASSLRCLGLGVTKDNRECIIPNIDERLVRHFIRGYFDGDGSFSVYQNTRKHVTVDGKYKEYTYLKTNFSIIVYEKFVYDFISILPGSYSINKSNSEEMVYIINSSKNDVLDIYNFLYEDSTIFMSRKHDKFLKYMEHLAGNC